MISKVGENPREKYSILFIICIWAYQPLILNISVLANKFVGGLFDIFFIALASLFFLMARPVWKNRIKIADIGFYLSCVFITLASITAFPDSAETIKEELVPFILQVLTFYFVGLLIDIEKYKDYMYWTSVLCILSQAFYFFFFLQRISSGIELKGDQIVPAIYTLPHVLMVLWYTLRKVNIINIAVTIMSIVLLLSFYNRGSIIAVLLFIIVFFFFLTPKKGSTSSRLILVLSTIAILILFDQIITTLFGFTESLGLSTSFFDRLANDEIYDSNGRELLYSQAIDQIINGGLFGGGMGIDRIVLGTYAHNFVLELLMDFGIFFGGIMVVSIFVLIICSFFRSQSLEVKAFIAVLCGRGLIHMLVSGSYIEDGHFFLLIGFCVAALRQSNNKHQSSTV